VALERGTFGWSNAVYPLTASTANSALKDADPALFYALDFWSTVLTSHLLARWTAECTAAGGGAADMASAIVKQTSSYDPAPYLKETQYKFPLLAVYRMRSTSRERTIAWENTESRWGVQWILPPLPPDQCERLLPFRKAVFDVLVNRTTNQQDPSYQSNAMVWHDLAKLDTVGFTDFVDYRPMQGTDTLIFPTVTMTAVVLERTMVPAGAYDGLTEADVDVQVDPDGTNSNNIDHFVDVKTTFP
jgi:hypothetical protein